MCACAEVSCFHKTVFAAFVKKVTATMHTLYMQNVHRVTKMLGLTLASITHKDQARTAQ